MLPRMSDDLHGKHILLGVTGGIAAYKAAELASRFVKAGAAVDVIMTDAACEFVTPLTFEAITHRQVYTSMWREHPAQPGHIALAERPHLAVIAPATANTLAKLAHGIADNLLTSVLLACVAPVLAAPAMNDNMYNAPVTQENLAVLARLGVRMVGPAEGRLASGKTGKGRMSEPAEIFAAALLLLEG